MKSPANTKPSTESRTISPLAITAIAIVILAGLVWGGMALYGALSGKTTGNYAEEVAKSLEEALVKAGGIKKCSRGDAGRVADNVQPWYESYFEVKESDDRTVALISAIARENGYSLTHASVANRGSVGAADQFVDKWYFDNTSKNSPYQDLERGAIDLQVPINAEGLATTCSPGIKIDAAHSAVGIQVRLPAFKR